MSLLPIARQTSLSDGVFRQLSSEIVVGRIAAGHPLPSERTLCEMLQVNRGAVREAVKRLAQAGLVESQHGAGNHVLDFRRTAGLDLLPHLLLRADGDVDLAVVRSVMEMRSALAPDIAGLCARRDPDRAQVLLALVEQMVAADGDLQALQALALTFWDELVEGSRNIAYRLALNSLRRIYEPVREAMAEVLAAELGDVARHRALAHAVRRGDPVAAREVAVALIEQGLDGVLVAISALQEATTEPLPKRAAASAGDLSADADGVDAPEADGFVRGNTSHPTTTGATTRAGMSPGGQP